MQQKLDSKIFSNFDEIKDFICPSCQMVALYPIVISCSHFFCRDCFFQQDHCQICNNEIWNKNNALLIQQNYHEDKKVFCFDCSWKGVCKDYQQHQVEHQYEKTMSTDDELMSLKDQLENLKINNQKLVEKNQELIQEKIDLKREVSNLSHQVKNLKNELYEDKPIITQKEVAKFVVPDRLFIENFLEDPLTNHESLKRTMVADFFNPKSILIEESYYLKFPFTFTFEVLNIQHFQNQLGFLIYNGSLLVGKLSVSKTEIQVKMDGKKYYFEHKTDLKGSLNLKFYCKKEEGSFCVNGNQIPNKLYGNEVFPYGMSLKFKPFIYYHFATPSNGRHFLVL